MPDRNLRVSMFGNEPMNSSIQQHNPQIEDNEEEEDIPSGGESIDNPHIRYELLRMPYKLLVILVSPQMEWSR